MTILKNAVSRDLLREVVFASIILATGLTIVAVTYSTNFKLAFLGLALAGIGAFLFYKWSKTGVAENAPVINLLLTNQKKIVWIYSVVIDVMPFGIVLYKRTTLVFKTLGGNEIAVRIPSKKRKVLLHWLGRLLPHATFGYSQKKENAYRRNPSMLLRMRSGGEGRKSPI